MILFIKSLIKILVAIGLITWKFIYAIMAIVWNGLEAGSRWMDDKVEAGLDRIENWLNS